MKNPYALRDGGAKEGFEFEWRNWIQQQEAIRREALTQQERDTEDAARRQIRNRMQSESYFT